MNAWASRLGLRLFLFAGALAVLRGFVDSDDSLGLFLFARALAVVLLGFFGDDGLRLFLFARAVGALAISLLGFSGLEKAAEGARMPNVGVRSLRNLVFMVEWHGRRYLAQVNRSEEFRRRDST